MTPATKTSIINILRSCISRTVKRVQQTRTYRPFHDALLTPNLVTASSFERSFSTSFGQGPIEEISQIIARGRGDECERQRETWVQINKGALDEIGRILGALRSGDSRPNWSRELAKIAAYQSGDSVAMRVISDLWIRRGEQEIFISIKTVKPNIDQTEKAKESLLRLKAGNPNCQVYFALYYNPGGPTKADYNWKVPNKIFDMIGDDVVLIGQSYWDFLGGDGTYESLIEIFAEVGNETRQQLIDLGH